MLGSVGGLLATIRDTPVAVSEARETHHGTAHSRSTCAWMSVVERAAPSTPSAVLARGVGICLAPVGGEAIAIAEALPAVANAANAVVAIRGDDILQLVQARVRAVATTLWCTNGPLAAIGRGIVAICEAWKANHCLACPRQAARRKRIVERAALTATPTVVAGGGNIGLAPVGDVAVAISKTILALAYTTRAVVAVCSLHVFEEKEARVVAGPAVLGGANGRFAAVVDVFVAIQKSLRTIPWAACNIVGAGQHAQWLVGTNRHCCSAAREWKS